MASCAGVGRPPSGETGLRPWLHRVLRALDAGDALVVLRVVHCEHAAGGDEDGRRIPEVSVGEVAAHDDFAGDIPRPAAVRAEAPTDGKWGTPVSVDAE